jgi:NAD(P)-dependent dehydrogenase (short-subunit alcohol dehydrogenase family)
MASAVTDAVSRPTMGVGPMTSIEGAVALVTGGRRGLGRAYVDALVRHGAVKVYATARRPASSEDPRVVAETLDVTDAESVRSLAERTGDVDIVVSNAGVLIPGPQLKSALIPGPLLKSAPEDVLIHRLGSRRAARTAE